MEHVIDGDRGGEVQCQVRGEVVQYVMVEEVLAESYVVDEVERCFVLNDGVGAVDKSNERVVSEQVVHRWQRCSCQFM